MQFWFYNSFLNSMYIICRCFMVSTYTRFEKLSTFLSFSHFSLSVTIGSQVIHRKTKFLFYKELECELVSFLSPISIIKPKKIPIPKLLILFPLDQNKHCLIFCSLILVQTKNCFQISAITVKSFDIKKVI